MGNYSQSTRRISIRIGFSILVFFLFLRPVTVSFTHLGSISILDIFGVVSSYLFFLGLLANLRQLHLELTTVLIILFSLHCLTGLAIGAESRDVIRAILPFLPFFLTKTIVRDERTTALLLKVLAYGYFIPIVVSIILIVLGKSDYVVTGSLVQRQEGLSSGVHTQGHLMFFFSFLFGLYFLLGKRGKVERWFMLALLVGSLFCAYKTYTRTVMLGAVVFWLSHTFLWKRKLFFFLLTAVLLTSTLFFSEMQNIATQQNAISLNRNAPDLDAASSGRLSIWKHNIELFLDLPLYTQLLGVGLGKELTNLPGKVDKKWWGSHNDYMSLLITTGLIGVSLYLMIYSSIFYFLLRAPIESRYRLFGTVVLCSVMIMNFVSNSYIVRFQMAQLFWFLFGLLYSEAFAHRSQEPALNNDSGSLHPARTC